MTPYLLIPTMTANLLSANRLTANGFTLIFRKGRCDITRNGNVIAMAELRSGLYYLNSPNQVYTAVKKEEHNENCIHSWHRKFGHRDPEAIRKWCSKGLMDGIKVVDCGIVQTCEVCLEGNFSRLPFPKCSESKSTAPIQLIHTDVCGPMRTGSVSGNRYFITFIDDYSKYCFVYFLQHKSGVFEKLKEFFAMVQNKFGRSPKVIRSELVASSMGIM